MVKRFTVLAIVLAAFFVLAVPALAATHNGYRADYTTSDACQTCHQAGQPANAPKVYNDWATTKHGTDEEAASAAKSLPYGSVCAGCHTANYDPGKVTPIATKGPTTTKQYYPLGSNPTAPGSPVPTATSTITTTSYGADPSTIPTAQAVGNAASSEFDIGCSSCHYGASVSGVLADTGNDVNDTAHTAAFGKLANAEICGACHSRFSYTTNTIAVTPIPNAYTVDGVSQSQLLVNGTPSPNPATTSLIQPQMAIGYPMIGASYAPLSTYLNVSQPGWVPTPTATATGYPSLQTYWVVDGTTTPWQQSGHDGSAAQYPEWLSSGHASSLVDLKAAVGPNPPASCLQCHSADYQISVANGKPVPTGAEAQYGDTCASCHTPHQAGSTGGTWSKDMDDQLVGNPSNPSDLCSTCHNSQIGSGVLAAGTTVYEDQQEVMNGTGAIGVPQGLPGVHKGKCVQCHMAPTSYSRGSAQLGGNHTMSIITPQDAVDATPVPVTTTVVSTAYPAASPNTQVITQNVDQASMPYSACSTCHNNNVQATASPQPIATATTTAIATPYPSVTATYITVTTTRNVQNQGDKGLWLQDTIDQRQQAMQSKYAEVASALHSAGLRMGYSGSSNDATYVNALNTQLNSKGSANWNSAELLWQKGYTDWTYVGAEGSWGIHNYQYDSLVIEAALNFANQVESTPQAVTLKASKTSVKKNTKVTYSGTVNPATAGTITIQKKSGSNWLTWKTAAVSSSGSYSLKVKQTSKGTFYYRAFFPAVAPYAGGTSAQIKVVVKKK